MSRAETERHRRLQALGDRPCRVLNAHRLPRHGPIPTQPRGLLVVCARVLVVEPARDHVRRGDEADPVRAPALNA
jgi:hypothetical protein